MKHKIIFKKPFKKVFIRDIHISMRETKKRKESCEKSKSNAFLEQQWTFCLCSLSEQADGIGLVELSRQMNRVELIIEAAAAKAQSGFKQHLSYIRVSSKHCFLSFLLSSLLPSTDGPNAVLLSSPFLI